MILKFQPPPIDQTAREVYAQKYKQMQKLMGGDWGGISYHFGILQSAGTPPTQYQFALQRNAATAYTLAWNAFPFVQNPGLAETFNAHLAQVSLHEQEDGAEELYLKS